MLGGKLFTPGFVGNQDRAFGIVPPGMKQISGRQRLMCKACRQFKRLVANPNEMAFRYGLAKAPR